MISECYFIFILSFFIYFNFSSIDPFNKNDGIPISCSLQRSCSDSSLTANVDENFEIDQVMTLAECDLTNSENNSTNDNGNCIYSVDF
jgi:hypothetical protein